MIYHSASKIAAIPIPLPTHIEITPNFFFVLLNSVNKVDTCLAPVAPRGCPNAIAPPCIFKMYIYY